MSAHVLMYDTTTDMSAWTASAGRGHHAKAPLRMMVSTCATGATPGTYYRPQTPVKAV